MPRILHTNYYSLEPLRILKNELPRGFKLATLPKVSRDELIKRVGQADYLLVSGRLRIDREVLEAGVNLKMIQRTGVGLNTLDLEAIREKGVPVYVNKGINSFSVAEHTIMLILSVIRRLPIVDASVKCGEWRKQELGIGSRELFNKTVGLIGMGNIGRKVAKMLQVFGARVLYYNSSRLSRDEERELQVSYSGLAKMLGEVDVLSLHCPLTPDTKGIIGKQEIAAMREGAFIINTSRGDLIDESALVESLKSGHLSGAGLDVYSSEPLEANNALLKLTNVVLTPHVAGVTLDSFQRMMHEAMRNIEIFDEGRLELIEEKRLLI